MTAGSRARDDDAWQRGCRITLDLDAGSVGHRLDREEPPSGRSSLCHLRKHSTPIPRQLGAGAFLSCDRWCRVTAGGASVLHKSVQ